MSIEVVRSAFLWCTIINYGFYLLWVLMFAFPHDWMHRIAGKLFHVSPDRFDTINFSGILFYKVMIAVFNLVPLIALYIVG